MTKTRDMSNILNGTQTSINADKLDGQDSNFYLDHNNFVNAPEAGIDLTALSVSIAAGADTSTLAYNNLTGVFTFTPQTVTGQTLTELKNDAETAATNAAGSATAANLSFLASEEQAELAKDWAIKENVPVENQDYSAKYNADLAASSATAAASSASSAATSANDANTSASEASDDATTASEAIVTVQTAEANTLAYKNTAQTAATNAATSASNASTSEGNAATSESNANTYANNAFTSASNASTSESNASTSASNAATSESNASTSASNAATSESNASTSASAAATSEANAAATYDNFDDRYLGAKSSSPSVDNDGDALVTGALYFDTTDGSMKVYNGSTWLDAYASLSGALIATNNLADLSNVSVARNNLGLGTAATTSSSDYAALTGASFTGDVTFGENNKAIFGAGSNLQIFHNGSNSVIKDGGVGNLYVQGTNLFLTDSAGYNFVGMVDNGTGGTVTLYHNNSAKLNTTATGIDVTGTVEADGLIVDSSNPNLLLKESDTSDLNTRLNSNFGSFRIASTNNAGSTYIQRFSVDHATGNISFYEDTGTTSKLTWNPSDEDLKFADNSKAIFGAGSDLQIYHDGSDSYINDSGVGDLKLGGNQLQLNNAAQTANYIYAVDGAQVELKYNNALKLATTATGIDVTGTVTADGLSLDNAQYISFKNSSNAPTRSLGINAANTFYIGGIDADIGDILFVDGGVTRARFANGGDISFYEDTGTTAKFFWDASAERLGLGTSSPSAPLEISTSNGDALKVTTSTGRADIWLTDTDTTAGQVRLRGDANNLVFITNFTERLRITDTGLVGIGTSSPEGTLHIENASNNSVIMDAPANRFNSIGFQTAGVDKWWLGRADSDQISGDAFFIGNDNGNVTDAGGFSNKLVITQSGSVGIGTNSPLVKLQVDGNITLTNSSNAILTLQPTYGAGTSIIDFKATGSANQNARISSGVGSVSNITFSTGGASLAERMRIDSSGRVGIGTSSPSSLLAVSSGSSSAAVHSYTNLEIESASHSALQFSGSTGAEQWIWFADDSSNPPVGGITYYHGGPYMGFRVEGSERMRIDGSGRVGIGTSSPTASLDIPAGGIRLNSSGSDTSSKVGNFGVAGFEGYIEPYDSNAFTNIVNTVASKGITFQTGGSERMRINSSGSVGIGTSSPAAQLHVQNSSGNSTSILGQYGTGTRAEITAFSNQVELRAYNGTNDVMTFKTGSTERMRIDNLGNIIVYGAGINYPVVATTFGRGPNSIGFTWSSPNIYGTVDNVVEMVVGTASDYRLKANDENLTGSLQTIMALRPVSYNPVNFDGVVDEGKQELGLIAHEVQAVRPSVVTGEKDAIGEDGNARYQSVNYAGLVPDLIAALQEAIAKIETLESRLDTLENK